MKPERLMSVPGIGQIIFSAMLAAIAQHSDRWRPRSLCAASPCISFARMTSALRPFPLF
jgi:hypothetical protein